MLSPTSHSRPVSPRSCASSARYPAVMRSGSRSTYSSGRPEYSEPETRHGDRRLVVVLLEEHPLQNLGALVSVLRREPRPFCEVPADRAGLGQRPTVVEDQRRHAQRGIQIAEQLWTVRAVCDVDRVPLVRQAEMGEQEPAPCNSCPRPGCRTGARPDYRRSDPGAGNAGAGRRQLRPALRSPAYFPLRSINSMRYESGSWTKQIREPPSRTR